MENANVQQNAQEFTQFLYHMATSQSFGLRKASEYLKEAAYTRPVRETLAKYAGKSPEDKSGLQKYIVEKLMEQSPAGTARESVERKVRIWMKDDTRYISKAGAVQVCFALHLSPENGNSFLQRMCGEGFHMRDPEEITFLYALKMGMSYQEGFALRSEMERKGLLAAETEPSDGLHTEVVQTIFDGLSGVDELESFLRQYQGQLGPFHNTAYHMFQRYLKLLTDSKIDDGMDEESILSVREVTDVYLHEKLIPRIKKAVKKDAEAENLVLSALQRDIQQNWPDETTLSRMLNRKVDVSRKALILLFLATDGGADLEDYENTDEKRCPKEPEEVFDDAYSRINHMLTDCGFAPLDARCAFDWMVLYCMCVDADDTFLIDGRIRRFLKEIFPMQRNRADVLQISCTGGPLQGNTWQFQNGERLLGRDHCCDVRLPADTPGVSRMHCRFRQTSQGWTITDLESSCGTYIAGCRIPAGTEYLLETGETIDLGSENISFQVGID